MPQLPAISRILNPPPAADHKALQLAASQMVIGFLSLQSDLQPAMYPVCIYKSLSHAIVGQEIALFSVADQPTNQACCRRSNLVFDRQADCTSRSRFFFVNPSPTTEQCKKSLDSSDKYSQFETISSTAVSKQPNCC